MKAIASKMKPKLWPLGWVGFARFLISLRQMIPHDEGGPRSLVKSNRFVHQDRPLREWLLQLVDDSSVKRREASRIITYSFFMPEELVSNAEVDPESIRADFGEAVRAALRHDQFPLDEYAHRLLSLCMALEQERMNVWRAQQHKEYEWHEAQKEKLGPNPSREDVRRYVRRACIRLARESRTMSEEPMEEALETGIAMIYVIGALGRELLPAAALLLHMLTDTHQTYLASGVLCRMGSGAEEFYPDLLRGLEGDDPNGYFSKPLGTLLRHIPAKVPVVLDMITNANPHVRINAIAALGWAGRNAMSRVPEVEQKLLAHMNSCPDREWDACAQSLGEIAITSKAVTLLLEATFPGSGERAGVAISSLGRIGRESERVVPRLITLLDEFEEPDPDWMYTGSHSRIVAALEAFGPDAQPAIPTLIERIWTGPQEYHDVNGKLAERREPDEAVVELLGEFGPAAADALPLLLAMRTEMEQRAEQEIEASGDERNEEGEMTEEDYCPGYILEAIRRIKATEQDQRD